MINRHEIFVDQDFSIHYEYDYTLPQETNCIDDLLLPTLELWIKLETHCLTDCCGLDALNFEKENIKAAAEEIGAIEISNSLHQLRSAIEKINAPLLSSTRLNMVLPQKPFLDLLDHTLNCIG